MFGKLDIEVLLLCDRVDEWLVSHLTEFEGKPLESVTKGDLDLGPLAESQRRSRSFSRKKANTRIFSPE